MTFNLLAAVSREYTLNRVILRFDVSSSVLDYFKNQTVFHQESE